MTEIVLISQVQLRKFVKEHLENKQDLLQFYKFLHTFISCHPALPPSPSSIFLHIINLLHTRHFSLKNIKYVVKRSVLRCP